MMTGESTPDQGLHDPEILRDGWLSELNYAGAWWVAVSSNGTPSPVVLYTKDQVKVVATHFTTPGSAPADVDTTFFLDFII